MGTERGIKSPSRDSGSRRWAAEVSNGVGAAQRALLELQRPDGHWCAELEGDCILESEYILTMHFLGRTGEERVRKAGNYLRRMQLEDGGWAIYPGGPSDVSSTTKAYFALKLLGDDPYAPHMARARDTVLELGGLDACNSFTKIYLSVFGQYDWHRCPAVPPELILLPSWVPFSIYEMSSWSRAIVVPLSIIWARKPYCKVPDYAAIAELRDGVRQRPSARVPGLRERAWVALFEAIDLFFKSVEGIHLKPARNRALRKCEEWTLARLEKSDGLGAIFPPIVNAIMAFSSLGYEQDHPALAGLITELDKLAIEEDDTLRVQPCFSPVWDTALSINALLETGVSGEDEAIQAATRWLLEREVRTAGDCQIRRPSAPVGGWYFEYANEFYPDCDDTAEILRALAEIELPDPAEDARRRHALERGTAWLESMQNRDGGWASFDRGCTRECLTFIPFADHNAMIDPSTTDITARALEAFAAMGRDPSERPVRAGIQFILDQQEADGAWYGRWGCNYIYGTWLALVGLTDSGLGPEHPAVRKGAAFLRGCQNEDGGWGELPLSYDDPGRRGHGPSTAAQTAWALMGLMAAGQADSPAVKKGVQYLLRTQDQDGTWHDQHWTGTGFPSVFYLRYHLYCLYFPLRAMASYEKQLRELEAAGEKVA